MFPGFAFSHFVSAPVEPDVQRQVSEIPNFPPCFKNCLIVGPEESGKTSCLFHYALHIAALGQKVTLICNKSKIETSPPALPPHVTKDDPVLQNIGIRYLESAKDLRKFGACLHLLDEAPAAILVDDISYFIGAEWRQSRHGQQELAKTLAHLHEAVESINQTNEDGRTCALVATDVSDLEPFHHQYLYQRWFPLMLQTKGDPLDVCLSVLPVSTVPPLPNYFGIKLHCSIFDGTFLLKTVEHDQEQG